MDNLASTRRSGGSLTHNREMAQRFLKALDPTAQRFTFQLLRDPPHRKSDPHPPGLRPMAHCSVDEALAMAKRWNTLQQGYGLFFTPNETDFLGRAKANIVRVRAVFV